MTAPSRVAADDVSPSEPMFRRLAAELTVVVEGKSLRGALQQIADRARVNLWIDRRVDVSRKAEIPAAPDAGAGADTAGSDAGPTVYDALARVANQADCVVFPVHNVVLVGRPAWVDQTAAALLIAEQQYAGQQNAGQEQSLTQRSDSATTSPPAGLAELAKLPNLASLAGSAGVLSWDKLTTPREALRRALGRSPSEPAENKLANTTPDPVSLPHDLWPAVRWTGLPRYAAATLVLAQFDRRLTDNRRLTDTDERNVLVMRRYAGGPAATAVRETFQEGDREAQLGARDGWTVVRARPQDHRLATAAFIRELASKTNSGPARGERTPRFDLRLINKPAGQVLKQLAGAAGKTCHINPQAAERCEVLVSLEAKDTTLEELAEQVGQQAGLAVDWDAAGGVRVRLP